MNIMKIIENNRQRRIKKLNDLKDHLDKVIEKELDRIEREQVEQRKIVYRDAIERFEALGAFDEAEAFKNEFGWVLEVEA